jgi:hypothetical protein
MTRPPCYPGVFGPLDGDFDPFEDDEDGDTLITFERGSARQAWTGMLCGSTRAAGRSSCRCQSRCQIGPRRP